MKVGDMKDQIQMGRYRSDIDDMGKVSRNRGFPIPSRDPGPGNLLAVYVKGVGGSNAQ
jgi:hypothetical protein